MQLNHQTLQGVGVLLLPQIVDLAAARGSDDAIAGVVRHATVAWWCDLVLMGKFQRPFLQPRYREQQTMQLANCAVLCIQ